MKKILSLIIITIHLNSFAQFTKFHYGDVADLEDYNKTLVIFERIFNLKPELDILKKISTEHFIKSNKFETLTNLIYMNSYVNLGYTEEIVEKEFNIKNHKAKLLIIFKKNKDLFWYIDNAYIIKNNKKISFKEHGFKPLAIEYNFIDFINAINNKSINKYSGLAPKGKLPVSFFKDITILPNEKSTLYIKNIIIHNKKNITGLYTLKLVYKKSLKNGKRGWLIDDFIPSLNFERRTLLIDYLLGNTKKYNLNKESNYFYDNIKNYNAKESDISIKGKAIILQDLNVRENPSIHSKIIGKVKKGKMYDIIDFSLPSSIIINNKKITDKWYKIKISNFVHGWVFGKYLDVIE